MSNFKAVLAILRKHHKFLVTTHHNPDADAISSALAMAIFLKALGKHVVVLNEDYVPQWLKFLPHAAWIKKVKGPLVNYDVAIVLDCGDLKRIGGVSKMLVKGNPLLNIDHHVTNDRFGTINVVDPRSSSTCEMMFTLLREARFPLTKTLATLIYAGMMTDTGSFRFDNTSARSHEIAGLLMAHGISAPLMYNRLFVGIPSGDIKLFIDLIHRADLVLAKKVYCVCLSKTMAAKFSPQFDLKEKIFSFLRSVEGVEVVVILSEVTTQEVRVNLRSQGTFNVALLARQFDGGGHVKAAGGKIYTRLDKAKQIICSAIAKDL